VSAPEATLDERPLGEPRTEVLVLNLGRLDLHRWWKNGDHPQDDVGKVVPDPVSPNSGETYFREEGRIVRYFQRPDVSGGARCPRCDFDFGKHGWIDSGGYGRVVCPGDWVAAVAAGQNFVFPNDLVELVLAADVEMTLVCAQEAAQAIDDRLAERTGPVSCIVQGMARAAAVALDGAASLSDGIEGA
jgi:hypothetical protein